MTVHPILVNSFPVFANLTTIFHINSKHKVTSSAWSVLQRATGLDRQTGFDALFREKISSLTTHDGSTKTYTQKSQRHESNNLLLTKQKSLFMPKIMPYPCHFYACVCPILTILNMNFASKEFTKHCKKTITWHVDKPDFCWNWPNSAIIWYSAWFYLQMSWISWRQFHIRFLKSSTIVFLPYCISPTILKQPRVESRLPVYIV